MKNNLCKNIEKVLIGDIYFIDYTNKANISVIPEKYYDPQYWIEVSIDDDMRFETMSYIYYGSVDYWDIIMSFNGLISLFDVPTNNDRVFEIAKYNFDDWFENFKIPFNFTDTDKIQFDLWYENFRNSYPSPNTILEEKLKEFEDQAFIDNEKNRIIRLIKPEYITNVLREL